MKWACLTLAAALALGGCTKTPRNLHAEVDADFTTGQVVLSCKASNSGTCHVLFVDDTGRVIAQAAAGSAGSFGEVRSGMVYCVDVAPPDPARCRPKPLVPGKQIVHRESRKAR